MVNDKLIAVSMETKERLSKLGNVDDSYGDVIEALLDYKEEVEVKG